MKKTYQKPELISKTFAQFENVFTACDRNPSRPNCTWCGPWNPGADSAPCPRCGLYQNQHSAHVEPKGS